MKESYMEGVASHHGPRSCATCSSRAPFGRTVKVRGEVSLTSGERASWVLSSESIHPGLPARLLERSAKRGGPIDRKGRIEPAES